MTEYQIGDLIKINYKNNEREAKILAVIKAPDLSYNIKLEVGNENCIIGARDLGLKVIDLDELGVLIEKEN